jgi:hypothetical protein
MHGAVGVVASDDAIPDDAAEPPRPRLGRPSFGSLEGKAVRDRKEAVRSLERHFGRVVHEHCPAVEEERMASSDRPVLVPVLR